MRTCSTLLLAFLIFLRLSLGRAAGPISGMIKKGWSNLEDMTIQNALSNGQIFAKLLTATKSASAFEKMSKLFPKELAPLFTLLTREQRIELLKELIDCSTKTKLNDSLGVSSQVDIMKKIAKLLDFKSKTGTPMDKINNITSNVPTKRLIYVTSEALNTLQCLVSKDAFTKFIQNEFPQNGTLGKGLINTKRCSEVFEKPPQLQEFVIDITNLVNQTIDMWGFTNDTKLIAVFLTALNHPMFICTSYSFALGYGAWPLVETGAKYLDSSLKKPLNMLMMSLLINGLKYVIQIPLVKNYTKYLQYGMNGIGNKLLEAKM